MSHELAIEIERNCQRCRDTVDEFRRASYTLLHPSARFPWAVVFAWLIGAATGVAAMLLQ